MFNEDIVKNLQKLVDDIYSSPVKSKPNDNILKNLMSLYTPYQFIETDKLPKTKIIEVEETVELSFKERYIEPLFHPVTVPFEPWIKTKKVTRKIEVLDSSICYMMGNYIIAPKEAINILKTTCC